MARFAPVAPIQVLEGLYTYDPKAFGTYHLLLAHYTVEHKQRFADLFQQAAQDGNPCTIIMDNSIVELGDAVSTEMILDAVKTVAHGDHTVFPVLPDVMGNGAETRKAVQEAYPVWEQEMGGNGFCVVCQGENFQDYIASVDMFTDYERFPGISVYSIPRVLHKTVGSRVKPALYMRHKLFDDNGTLREGYSQAQVHFLGFSDSITDDIDAVKIMPAAGIDSAVPLRCREVFTEFSDPGKRPPQWFETTQLDSTMLRNLGLARDMFGDR